jgi:hypothetical protein
MPPVQSLTLADDLINIQDVNGAFVVTTSMVPPTAVPAIAEAWLNGTWVPANIVGYQLVFHVLTMVPHMTVKLLALDMGVAIPVNWWLL